MTLTTLRRLVLVADALGLAVAGGAAWFSLKAVPVAAKDWPKIFPVRPVQLADLQAAGPGAKEQYTASVNYPQGDKPVPVVAGTAEVVKPVDDFLTKYRLNGIFLGSTLDSSFAQLQTGPKESPMSFTVGLGGQIPAEIGTGQDSPPLTPWRLNELREAEWDAATKQVLPCAAIFIHNETFEKKTLEMVAGNPTPTLQAKEAPPGPGIGVSRPPGPRKDLPFRGRRIQTTNPNEIAWEFSEEEVDFLETWSADQTSRVSIVESKDADGKPDGFTLKGVPKDSRAADIGFQSEDKVISVNNEKVSSTADAMAKGKKQFEGGTTVFQLKVLRKGKEMIFTIHAPPKKKGKP